LRWQRPNPKKKEIKKAHDYLWQIKFRFYGLGCWRVYGLLPNGYHVQDGKPDIHSPSATAQERLR